MPNSKIAKSSNPEMPKCRNPKLPNSRNPEIPKHRNPEIPKSRNPVILPKSVRLTHSGCRPFRLPVASRAFPLLPVPSRCFWWLPAASGSFSCTFSLLINANLCVWALVPLITPVQRINTNGVRSHAKNMTDAQKIRRTRAGSRSPKNQ